MLPGHTSWDGSSRIRSSHQRMLLSGFRMNGGLVTRMKLLIYWPTAISSGTLHDLVANQFSLARKFQLFLQWLFGFFDDPRAKMQDAFLNRLTICIKKKQKIELTKEEGWHSESELVALKWAKSGSHLITHKKCSIDIEFFKYSLFESCSIPRVSGFLSQHQLLRQKIDGAKAKCKALGETHYRHPSTVFEKYNSL